MDTPFLIKDYTQNVWHGSKFFVTFGLMCFDRSINGNRDVTILECDYIFVCVDVRETRFSNFKWLAHYIFSCIQSTSLLLPAEKPEEPSNSFEAFKVHMF